MQHDESSQSWKEKAFAGLQRGFLWGDKNIPPGFRILAGIPLFFAGFVGFLPILGFWMTPLGFLLIALDIPPLRRWVRRKLKLEDISSA